MQSDTFALRSRFGRAFRRVRLVLTPISFLRVLINSMTSVGAAYFAMKITGILPFFDAFCEAHGVLLSKTIVVAFVIYPFFHLLGMCVMEIIKGFFNLDEKTAPLQPQPQP